MKFKQSKFIFIQSLYNLVKNIAIFLFAFFVYIGSNLENYKYVIIIIFIIFCIVNITTTVFSWKNTTLELNEKTIDLVYAGLFNSKKQSINHSNVASINIDQTFIQRIFQCGKMSITTKSSSGIESDSIDIIVSKNLYHQFKTLYEQHVLNSTSSALDFTQEQQAGSLFTTSYEKTYSYKDAILWGTTTIIDHLEVYLFIYAISVYEVYNDISSDFNTGYLLVIIVITLFSAINNFTKLLSNTANLSVKIFEQSKKVEIKSELLSAKHIEFKLDKVKTIYEKYNRLLKKSSIQIGISNSQVSLENMEAEEPFFGIMLSKEQRQKLLTILNVDFEYDIKLKPINLVIIRLSLTYLLIVISLVSVYIVFSAMLPIIQVIAICGFILATIIFILKLFSYLKTNFFNVSSSHIEISAGFIVQNITYIQFENIESVKFYQGPIDRLLGIGNLEIVTFQLGASKCIFNARSYKANELQNYQNHIIAKIENHI